MPRYQVQRAFFGAPTSDTIRVQEPRRMPRDWGAARRAARLGGLAAVALGAVLLGPASPATARQPDPPRHFLQDAVGRGEPATGPTGQGEPTMGPAKCTVEAATVVCTVEVPVRTPIVIRDRATEMLHLGIAAGLGAALAVGASTARRRRPPPTTGTRSVHPSCPADGPLADNLIDITDIVQSRAAA
jgi:hypothetical protein